MEIKLWRHSQTGYYRAVWMEKGKQRKKSLRTKVYREARKRFNQFKQDLIQGKIKPIKQGYKIRFRDFETEALKYYESNTEYSTYKLYETTFKKAKSSWGDIHLGRITSRHIDNFIADLALDGLKTATVNKYFRHIKSIMNLAYRWEYIKTPIRFKKETKAKEELRYLTSEQLNEVIDKIKDDELRRFCFFSAATGLRISEIIRLKWQDIDNPKGYMRITPEQKNKKDLRIPINDYASELLGQQQIKDIGPIFRFKSRHWPSRLFKEAATKAGYPNARFHDLRHTFGTSLVKAKVDIRTIQKLMRHSDLNSTMVYAKVLPEHLVESSNKLDYGPLHPKLKRVK